MSLKLYKEISKKLSDFGSRTFLLLHAATVLPYILEIKERKSNTNSLKMKNAITKQKESALI